MRSVLNCNVFKLGVNLIVVFYLSLSNQLECDRRIYCQDLQIISQRECCYLHPGESCYNGSLRICESEMRYSCVFGKCAGKYNLSVNFVDGMSINLTWSPFLPAGSNLNYTVLYSTEFNEDPLLFSSHLVGTKNSYLLQWLTPGMLYFIRVGVWTGLEYKNLTEILKTKTKVTDHCQYNGRRVLVGEQLIVDCEESCYCSSTGRFSCVPVCSKQHPNTRTCSDTEARENCCDVVQHCSYDACTYLGKPVEHEYSWVIDCAENCTCNDGSVTCVPHCADVTVPENCSNPILTKTDDGCCDLYECNELDICEYMNSSYRVGTWFQNENCEVCTCKMSTKIECVNMSRCTPAVIPEQSAICPKPAQIDNRCCSQIVCDTKSEKYDVLSMYTITKYSLPSSIIVRFQFISTKDEQSAIEMTLFYTTDVINSNFTVWASNVTVKFSDVINTSSESLEFRDFGKPYVFYRVKKNYLLVIPKLLVNIFYYVKLRIVFDRTRKAIPEYIAKTRVLQLPGVHVVAEPSYIKTRVNKVNFVATNSTSNTAVISWTLPEYILNRISSVVIKYKPFSRTEWQYTERLIFSDTSIMLKCLYHSTWYDARLLAQPGDLLLDRTFFNTSSIKEVSTWQYSLLLNVSIRDSSVIMAWNPLPEKLAADVNEIEILWTRSHNEDSLLKSCVSATSDSYVLQDLVPGCIYTVWLGISRKDGTVTFTNRMHFVSLHHYSSSHSENQHSIVVAITVACVSLITMVVAIVTVIYLLKCKHRATYLEHTSFENRIFQIYDNKDDREL